MLIYTIWFKLYGIYIQYNNIAFIYYYINKLKPWICKNLWKYETIYKKINLRI